MANYRLKSKAELKEIALRNNIKISVASGKYGKIIKEDYLIAIMKTTSVNVIARRVNNSCEWLLVGKTSKCSKPRTNKDVFCSAHAWGIRQGKSKPVACKRCKMGTKAKAEICTKCAFLVEKKFVLSMTETQARKNHNFVMKELIKTTPHL